MAFACAATHLGHSYLNGSTHSSHPRVRANPELAQPRKLCIAVVQGATRQRAVVEALPRATVMHPRVQAHVVLVI
eukprot:1060154-Prymnesium_polylepis.1